MSTTDQTTPNYIPSYLLKPGARISASIWPSYDDEWVGPLDEDYEYEAARDRGEV